MYNRRHDLMSLIIMTEKNAVIIIKLRLLFNKQIFYIVNNSFFF